MANILVLKYNAASKKEKHDEAVDSVKFASFLTANYELTDTKLGHLVDGAEASDEHIHDARYFRENEFISSSAGGADAGKPILADTDGKISDTFIDDADISHDSTDGMAASTGHLAFPLLVGGRDFTAIQKYDAHKTFTLDTEIVDKKYVDDSISTSQVTGEWWASAISIELDSANIVGPSTGDRYLINGVGLNDFVGHDYEVAEWNGSSWDFTSPTVGTRIGVDDENTALYYYGGSDWTAKYFESTTASLGCKKVGFDIQTDLQASGGIKLNGNSLLIEPNDFAGEGLVDDGSDNLAIDWSTSFNDAKAVKASDLSSTSTGLGASIIGIEDSAGLYTSTNVEAAFAEVMNIAKEGSGINYIAGTGGISKGDLVYISAANTVLPLTTLTSDVNCVGIALETVAAGNEVKVANFDTLLLGALTGANPNDTYYWDGSGFSTTPSAVSNENVWQVGYAKNATDLALNVVHLYKNP